MDELTQWNTPLWTTAAPCGCGDDECSCSGYDSTDYDYNARVDQEMGIS